MTRAAIVASALLVAAGCGSKKSESAGTGSGSSGSSGLAGTGAGGSPRTGTSNSPGPGAGTGSGEIVGSDHGTGGIGLRGTGSGSADPDAGSGRGMRARRAVPTVEAGELTASGGYDVAVARRSVLRQMNRLRFCYEKRLDAAPGLTGTVTVEASIDGTGRIVRLAATGGDEVVAACFASAFQAVQFPAPAGGAAVQLTYPFVLKPPAPAELPAP